MLDIVFTIGIGTKGFAHEIGRLSMHFMLLHRNRTGRPGPHILANVPQVRGGEHGTRRNVGKFPGIQREDTAQNERSKKTDLEILAKKYILRS